MVGRGHLLEGVHVARAVEHVLDLAVVVPWDLVAPLGCRVCMRLVVHPEDLAVRARVVDGRVAVPMDEHRLDETLRRAVEIDVVVGAGERLDDVLCAVERSKGLAVAETGPGISRVRSCVGRVVSGVVAVDVARLAAVESYGVRLGRRLLDDEVHRLVVPVRGAILHDLVAALVPVQGRGLHVDAVVLGCGRWEHVVHGLVVVLHLRQVGHPVRAVGVRADRASAPQVAEAGVLAVMLEVREVV